ncbi:hypothetical protein ASD45_03305 [Pseudolabrys sp. Root1462]|jgi:hypothetical protein|uniref:hypothetical protein n=1 Tax=Pseudolabrys sp. Root1462 TaxID=1736466 RepID=UPI00070312E8|nr:hypothetical protein [Pseudolabrys sp. Root1462]KQY99936.1 hypothetical protein ASD45_03305 [Pseudolabrys sp. Root1462]
MKKILIAGVLAVVAASPALAASNRHRAEATQSYDYAPSSPFASAYGPSAGTTVVSDGKVIGADPDPFIRQQLQREGNPGDLEGGN